MPRAWIMLGLALGCGPIVATGDGDDTGGGGHDDDDDDRGDDRPGTGPRPMTSPTTLEDDGPVDDGDDEFDDGWTPDFWDGVACGDSTLDACFEASELDAYEGEVLAIAVGHVTNDAHQDLLVLGELWQVVHPGESGSWSDPISTASPFDSPSAAALGWVANEDGVPDLVVIQYGHLAVFAAAGTGAGKFLPPTQVDLPAQPLHMQTGDIDGMLPNEVVVSLDGGSIAVVRFDPPLLEVFDAPVFEVRALAVGDVGFAAPGDDLIVAGTSIDQNLLGVNSYQSASAGQWSIETFVASPISLTVRDFDGSGAFDIATAAGESAFMYPRDGEGTFGEPVVVPLASTALAAAGGWFGLSVQGLATVVDGTVQIVDFQANDAQIVNGPSIRPPLVAADVNADGRDDIIAPSSDGERVVVYASQP